jgi:hypothetical protein
MFGFQFKTYKVIYRRYAGLFFSLCVDVTDNELLCLEAVHLFVEILDHYFQNVCELDLVFNFHKVTHAELAAVCPCSATITRTCRCTSSLTSSSWLARSRRQARRYVELATRQTPASLTLLCRSSWSA